MLIWLLVPTARCSFGAFRATPLDEVRPPPPDPGAPDDRPAEPGFFSRFGHATVACYRKTPITGQEPWKTDVLAGLAAATVLAGLAARIDERRGRRYLR